MPSSSTQELLLTWYGDDFTGASAVMEALTFAGVPAVLFLEMPTREQLAQFPEIKAFGLATTARSKSPQWMEENLPVAFKQLGDHGAPLVHYKVCSTLDSAPHIGSIGKAMEIGSHIFEPQYIPIMVAAPDMRRYQYFGDLFAAMGEEVYRIDQHPVMARHPVTPIHESNVARHISLQTDALKIAQLTIEKLEDSNLTLSEFNNSDRQNPMGLSIDCIGEQSERSAGKLIWEGRNENRFVVGSQGVEYALIRHWRKLGIAPMTPPIFEIKPTERMVIVSGSVSPVTATQIAWSRANGFECISFDTTQTCLSPQAQEAEIKKVIGLAMDAVNSGKDPLIYSAQGPDDPSVAKLKQMIASSGSSLSSINETIGVSLGKILKAIVTQAKIKRAVISGGDTSGYATQQLDLFALSALAPTIPGAALFLAHAHGPMDGLELALKGGQMGSEDYFGWIKNGGTNT